MTGMFQTVYTTPSVKKEVNVGQFGWTGQDEKDMNAINSYLAQIIKIANEMTVKYSEVKAIADGLEQIKLDAETLSNKVAQQTAEFDLKYEEFLDKYGNIPRVYSFCHYNEAGYESPDVICWYTVDKNFHFGKDFKGSSANYILMKAYPQLPSAGLIDVYVLDKDRLNGVKVGTIQLNPDHTSVFQTTHDSYAVTKDSIIEFRVSTLEGISSVSVSLVYGD